MSIEVPLDQLGDAVAARDFGYLLTAGDDGRPKAVALRPTVDGHELRFDAGGGSARNAASNPQVSVVFPPTGDDAFSLVVDGAARVEGESIVVTATWAVRHRPAP